MGWCRHCESEQEDMKSRYQCRPCNYEKRRKKYARERGAVLPPAPSHLSLCGLCNIHKNKKEMSSKNRCRNCVREQARIHARKRTKEQRQAERKKMYEKQGRRYQTLEEKRVWTQFKRDTRAIIKRLRQNYKDKELFIKVGGFRFIHEWQQPHLSPKEKYRLRYRTDPEFNLKERLRAHHRRMTRRGYRIGDLYRRAINTNGRSPTAEAFTGYTVAELKKHLEKQFTKGMNWEKFMAGEIHIDHIIPLSSFDRTNEDEVKAAWQLSNLRPLWAKDNIRKAAKREGRLL